mgnify:CR=1 FL=1
MGSARLHFRGCAVDGALVSCSRYWLAVTARLGTEAILKGLIAGHIVRQDFSIALGAVISEPVRSASSGTLKRRPSVDDAVIHEFNDSRHATLVEAMQRTAEGSEIAMRTIYVLTSAQLYALCARVCGGNHAAASDALQDTYIAIWQRAQSFQARRARPITWSSTIARNKSIDQLRKYQNIKCYGLAINDIADDRLGADETVMQAQAACALGAYVAKLSSRDAELISAIFDEHLTYLALANRIGSPLSTIKSRMRRMLLAMKTELSRGT